jgi:eukaryotic-like serine/threonine-protein kinase
MPLGLLSSTGQAQFFQRCPGAQGFPMAGPIYLGKYEIMKLLGEGGMGRAFLAYQLDLKREVVVKVLHDHVATDPKFLKRFRREMLVMARFQHPHAVALYDASLEDPKGPCIIMEYINGIDLDTLRKNNQGRLSPGRAGRLLGQLCDVLRAAHSEGIIHRDLKPANLMVVDPETPHERIKVLDFGLAKLRKSALQFHSVTGISLDANVGTPAYMSPEQCQCLEVDHRADLYSVGVIWYELLTGQLPFAGTTPVDVMLKHAFDLPPPFAAVGAAGIVSATTEAVVLSCLAKDPAQRPQSAREVAERYEAAWLDQQDQGKATVIVENQPIPAEATPGGKLGSVPLASEQKLDPHAVIYQMEAATPEAIANYKVRHFIQDTGGELLADVSGLIRVRLGGWTSVYKTKTGYKSWLGLRRKSGQIEMELRIHKPDPKAKNLKIEVLMHPLEGEPPNQAEWHARCNRIYHDLRRYLTARDS